MEQTIKNLKRQASPYFASVNFDPKEDTEDDRIELTRKFSLLPKAIRYGLLDSNAEWAIERIAKSFGITDPKKVGEISRIIRDRFSSEIGEVEIKKRAKEAIGIEEGKLSGFAQEIAMATTKIRQEGEQQVKDSIEQLPIIPALKKYDLLGEQEITESQIQIEASDKKEYVAPSIKNWLEDYIQNKGAQAHENLERSDYLYKSFNTEFLSTTERDRLAVILRSYDMDELVTVNKMNQEVEFDAMAEDGNLDSSGTAPEDENENVAKADEEKGQKASELSENEPTAGLSGNVAPSKKPHEIYWYGQNSGFDSLEKIPPPAAAKDWTGSQERLESKSALANQKGIQRDYKAVQPKQNTKHVVNLKDLQQ